MDDHGLTQRHQTTKTDCNIYVLVLIHTHVLSTFSHNLPPSPLSTKLYACWEIPRLLVYSPCNYYRKRQESQRLPHLKHYLYQGTRRSLRMLTLFCGSFMPWPVFSFNARDGSYCPAALATSLSLVFSSSDNMLYQSWKLDTFSRPQRIKNSVRYASVSSSRWR